jgi:hypothetical protein
MNSEDSGLDIDGLGGAIARMGQLHQGSGAFESAVDKLSPEDFDIAWNFIEGELTPDETKEFRARFETEPNLFKAVAEIVRDNRDTGVELSVNLEVEPEAKTEISDPLPKKPPENVTRFPIPVFTIAGSLAAAAAVIIGLFTFLRPDDSVIPGNTLTADGREQLMQQLPEATEDYRANPTLQLAGGNAPQVLDPWRGVIYLDLESRFAPGCIVTDQNSIVTSIEAATLVRAAGLPSAVRVVVARPAEGNTKEVTTIVAVATRVTLDDEAKLGIIVLDEGIPDTYPALQIRESVADASTESEEVIGHRGPQYLWYSEPVNVLSEVEDSGVATLVLEDVDFAPDLSGAPVVDASGQLWGVVARDVDASGAVASRAIHAARIDQLFQSAR